jgi:peptide/nickel transport system ATP-binding protein
MSTGTLEIAAPSPSPVVRPLVEVEDLCVKFVSREETVRAVNGVSFRLMPGEVLCLIGESGSGKTVTMRALMRLLPLLAQRRPGAGARAAHARARALARTAA